MGSGRYSEKLDYADWFIFNNFQRMHYNFLEHIWPAIAWLFIGGYHYPLEAAILGYVYFLGRVIYSAGYAKTPNMRLVGALVLDLAIIALFVLSIVSVWVAWYDLKDAEKAVTA